MNKTTSTKTIVENKQNNCFYLHVVVKLIRQNNSKGGWNFFETGISEREV